MANTRSELLTTLAARPGQSQRELAQRTGASTRTVRRHLGVLVGEGLVRFDEDGSAHRYALTERAQASQSALPVFSEGEVEALSVAIEAAGSLLASTPLGRSLESAARKLRREWERTVILFDAESEPGKWSFDGAAGGASVPAEPAVFDALLHAARAGEVVRASYYTASRGVLTHGRRLAPLGFLVRGGAWMVAAVDLDSRSSPLPVKDFALPGFRTVEVTGEIAAAPAGFDLEDHGRDRFGALDGEVEEVRLIVEAEAAAAFRRKQYSPTQQIEQERADGRLVVSFEVSGLDAVRAWVLSWGGKVRVVAPESLVSAVREAHRRGLDRYEEGDDA